MMTGNGGSDEDNSTARVAEQRAAGEVPNAPALPGRVRYMLATGAPNPWNRKAPRVHLKRSLVSDVSTGERVDVGDPIGEQAFQSIVWGIRSAGWSRDDAARLLLGSRGLQGTRWLNRQPNPIREFIRSWDHADISVRDLQARNKGAAFEVFPWLVEAVWAYVLNHPGVSVREMYRDAALLPTVRASRRHGIIDAARKVLREDGRVRTEGGELGQRLAHFSTIDKFTGEVLEKAASDVSDADLDALVPVCSGARRVALMRVSHNPHPPHTRGRVCASRTWAHAPRDHSWKQGRATRVDNPSSHRRFTTAPRQATGICTTARDPRGPSP